MDKEEIKKRIKVVEKDECDKCYFPKKRSCRSCIKQSYKEIKRYIKELEQKKSILDKVTDTLKEICNKYIKEYKNVEKLDLIGGNTAVLQELSCVIDDIEEILNIIESK